MVPNINPAGAKWICSAGPKPRKKEMDINSKKGDFNMNEKKQAIIEKIQKILIQAKDQENTPEGDTFKKHAALLMAKYRIKETEIDLETDNFILDTFEFQNDRKIQPQWVGRVVYTFANLFDCETIMRKKWDSQEYEFIGLELSRMWRPLCILQKWSVII